MARGRFRGGLRALVTALGAALLIVGALLNYVRAALVDESGFVRRVSSSLNDDRVSGLAAREIVEALIAEQPDLVAVRPLLLGTVEAVISSGAARTVVGTAARAGHHLLFTDAGEDVLFTLDDVNVLVRAPSNNPIRRSRSAFPRSCRRACKDEGAQRRDSRQA